MKICFQKIIRISKNGKVVHISQINIYSLSYSFIYLLIPPLVMLIVCILVSVDVTSHLLKFSNIYSKANIF